MSRRHSVSSYHDIVRGGTLGQPPALSVFEPLNENRGTLANGVTWTRTFSNTTEEVDGLNGDVRWGPNGIVNYVFSAPVDFRASPTQDESLGNPIVWTHGNGNPAPSLVDGPFTEIVTGGGTLSYTPGAVDAQIVQFSPTRLIAGQPNSSNMRATDAWGFVLGTGVPNAVIQGRDAEAMRFEARPI